MSTKLTRRSFLARGGALGLISASGCRTIVRDFGAYSVSILGDTHFDAAPSSVYHAGWTPRDADDARDRRNEFARNAEMWSDRLPRLVAAAARTRRADAAFLLQMGDLIQGDCGSDAARRCFLADAVAACSQGFGDLPFLTVCGNHDIRNGGAAAYDAFMLPRVGRVVGRPVGSMTFLHRVGPDAFIFIDFMRPDARRIDALLDASEDARHTFVVLHSAIAPTDTWGTYWFLFGKPEDAARRRALFVRLLKRRAVVLGGHIHRTQIRRWRRPEGELVEFCMNSVWRAQENAVTPVFTRPDQYGSHVKAHPAPFGEELDGCHQRRTVPELLALVDEYRPGLVDYRLYQSAGHYQLRVSDRSVVVDFFACDACEPTLSFNLIRT